jgi:hypothetical protein
LNYSVVVNETGSSYLIGVKCHKREEFVVRDFRMMTMALDQW